MPTYSGAIVIGHPRSGTTLLRRILGGHSDLAAPPETFLFDAAARFLHADISSEGTDVGVVAGLNFIGFDDEDTLGRLRELCFGFLDEYAAREDRLVWVEKTAFHAFMMDKIVRLCGDRVRYIGVVRHPFDVAASTIEFCAKIGVYPDALHRYVRQHNQPLEAFIRSWRDVARNLVELGQAKPNNCMIIRYEDLVVETEETVRAVLEFLDVDSDTDFVESALLSQGTPGFSDHKAYRSTSIQSDRTQRWKKLPRAQLTSLAPLVFDEMEIFGYEAIDSEVLEQRLIRRSYLRGLAFGSKAE